MLGLGDAAGNVSSVFVFIAGDGPGISVRAALLFRRAGLAGQFQSAALGPALTGRPAVRIEIVPAELLQLVPPGADIQIFVGVPFEVRLPLGAIAAARPVEYQDV